MGVVWNNSEGIVGQLPSGLIKINLSDGKVYLHLQRLKEGWGSAFLFFQPSFFSYDTMQL